MISGDERYLIGAEVQSGGERLDQNGVGLDELIWLAAVCKIAGNNSEVDLALIMQPYNIGEHRLHQLSLIWLGWNYSVEV